MFRPSLGVRSDRIPRSPASKAIHCLPALLVAFAVKLSHLAVLSLALTTSMAFAGERGYLGLAVAIDGDGFFLNPTLKTVKVEKVVPNSPAAKAGLVPGDLIVEIEGRAVAGAKAKDLQPYLQRDVGESTRMVVKKTNGDTLPLSLVAVPMPVSQ